MTVNVTVTNTGKTAGDEVVQLYLSHKNAPFKTPIRTLKGFQRLYLKAGESRSLTFKLGKTELSEIDGSGKVVPMRGDFEVSVGGSQPSEKGVLEKKVIQKMVKIM